MNDAPFRSRNSDRRVIPWLLFGLLLLFGGLYVAGYVVSSDKVPHGTTVAGVEIGGQTPAQARRTLAEGLRERAAEPIVVTASGARTSIEPDQVGLRVDLAASVAQAGAGRSWSLSRMWDYFTGGDDWDAVVRVDSDALDAKVGSFADRVDVAPREGGVVFRDGEADPRDPETGHALDRDAAAAAVESAFLKTEGEVALPVVDVDPEVSAEEVSRAMDEFANPAMSAPVVLVIKDENVVLRPEAYSSALSMKAKEGRLVPQLDEDRLIAAVKPAMKRLAFAPRDATVRLVNGRPQVVPAKRGVTFDRRQVTDEFLALVVARGRGRTLEVKSVAARPAFTTAEARALRINERVSSFTTYFPHADYRNTNLGRAAELISGTVLKPGDTFSLNDTVGERTRANGFTKGFIISDGVYKEDFGGGVSQVATTTFNAAFFAGLEDVAHKTHSFYIDRYPMGREATVAWPSVDLKFKNDTPYGVLIEAWIDRSTPSSQGAMHVRMWSTKYWDIKAGISQPYNRTQPETRRLKGDDCVPNEGYGGFDVDVYRYFYRHGSDALDHRETMHTTYIPSDTVVCS